jgi:urate oxidase
MPAAITWNRYGKSRVRLVKVRRAADAHDLVDLTIDVALEGAFDAVYTDGDNRSCLATDTMKNTVYAFARRDPIDHVEVFVSRLAEHFAAKPGVSLVRIDAAEHPWEPLSVVGRPHPHAFARRGAEDWTALVTCGAGGLTVTAGLRGLAVLKTADSAFAGFPRDEHTTLPDTRDRILATSITAAWQYASGFSEFAARTAVRTALVETFASHRSESAQHTLYAMGEAALSACPGVTDIQISLPNRHHLLVDLAPFGVDNPNEIFVPTDQPFGLIEARVSRTAPAGRP